jgi:DNA-binding winged helix-turn-helix (wHTH) protein
MIDLNIENLKKQLFYINRYCVDANRNTIAFNGNVQSIEPKVMQCLLVLVSNNGRVVSQETLFKQVWPNSVFSPGSIRRAVAILRKALGTDSTEDLLKTIPKKGYELNAKIVFHRQQKITKKSIYLAMALGMFFILFVVFFAQLNRANSKIVITKVEPITATSALEFNAKLSPDDAHVAFMRTNNDESDPSGLWVKDIATNNEKLIFSGEVTEFSWLASNQGLVFTNKEDHKLYLQKVNLVTSIIEPVMKLSDYLQPRSSVQSGKSEQLFLLGNSSTNDDAILQNGIYLWAINLKTKKVAEKLAFDTTFQPYEISTNKQKSKLAIAGFNQQGETQIKVFDLDKNHFLPTTILLDKNRYFLSWHPSGKALLLSDGRQLSTVNFSGKWQKLNFESYDFVQHPQYTGNANAIFFSYAKLDIDIAQLDLDTNQTVKLIDSNTVDRAPALSPNGQKLAFISQRKGYPQIYVLDLKTKGLMLVYDNEQQWLGLSSPVWGSNNRLAFSNYDFPVVVTLKQNNADVHQFKQPIGVVADFYQDNTLLVSPSKQNTHIKVDISTEQTLHRFGYLAAKVILRRNNEICRVKNNIFQCNLNNQLSDIYTFKGQVLNWHKSGEQILFTVKRAQDIELIVLNASDYQQQENLKVPQLIDDVFAEQNNQILIEQYRIDKDIVKLTLQQNAQ